MIVTLYYLTILGEALINLFLLKPKITKYIFNGDNIRVKNEKYLRQCLAYNRFLMHISVFFSFTSARKNRNYMN